MLRKRRAGVAVVVVAVVVSGCGQAVASRPALPVSMAAPPVPTASAAPKAPAASTGGRAVAAMTTQARTRYAQQVNGTHSLAVLHRLGSDPQLLNLMANGSPAAVRSYVAYQYPRVWYHWHISRLRIISAGGRVVTETGVRFVMPAESMTLRAPGGRALGTLQVSMQDEIGFVRLMHRRYHVDVVIRGVGPTHVRSSMRAAGLAKLPPSGSVVLGHAHYRVGSFHELAWNGEPVTIWILMKA